MSKITKITNRIMLWEAYVIITLLLFYLAVEYDVDEFLAVVPTVIFFGFWIAQIYAHAKGLEKKLIKLLIDEKKIKNIAWTEFRKSFFYEIAVLEAVNFLIMWFKYSDWPVDLISLAIMLFCIFMGYGTSSRWNKYENYAPVFGIIATSVLVGECSYLLDKHKNPQVFFLYTLIAGIITDACYLIKTHIYKYEDAKPKELSFSPTMGEDLPGIEGLRQMVKLNFSDYNYEKYLSLIEPGIRSIITNYMRSWQDIESVITRMVMVHKQIYKTDLQFLSLPLDAKDKYSDQVDVDRFNRVKFGMSFKDKIDYLKNVGILQNDSHNMLYMLNKRRNMIHEVGEVFSQRDLNIFAAAYSVVFYILMAMTKTGFGTPEMNAKVMNDAEIWSANLVSAIETIKS